MLEQSNSDRGWRGARTSINDTGEVVRGAQSLWPAHLMTEACRAHGWRMCSGDFRPGYHMVRVFSIGCH
jgi:hypothetical protein